MKKLQLIKTLKYTESYDDIKLIKILKDEETNEKLFEVIEKPVKTFYMTKPEYRDYIRYNMTGLDLDMVDEIQCEEHEVLKTIAYEIGEEDLFWDRIKAKKGNINQTFHLNPHVHGSDMNIEDLYIAHHYEEVNLEDLSNRLTKAYFDIEVDGRDVIGVPKPEEVPAPVNLITMYNDISNEVLVLSLIDPDNGQQTVFMEELDRQEAIRHKIISSYKNDRDKEIDDVIFRFYDDELDLIHSFFKTINMLKPDVLMAWNGMGFDYPYLYNRIKLLGANPEDIICSPEIPYKVLYLYEDTFNTEFSDNSSYMQVSNFTIFLDQLLLYANIRKPLGKKNSYALDDIGLEEVGVNKVVIDPNNEGIDIKNLVERDFERFILYGIQDSLLLYLIEDKNMDADLLKSISDKTQTRIHQALKKTICLKNYLRSFMFKNKMIMSNNPNTNWANMNPPENKRIVGSFVGDPNNNANVGIEIVKGSRSKYIHNNVATKDFGSLYPNVSRTYNIGQETMIGKPMLLEGEDETKFKRIVNPTDLNRDLIALMTDDLISQDYVSIGEKYMGLKSAIALLAEKDKIL